MSNLEAFNKRKYLYLIASIILDVLGMGTFAIPVLGETGDVVFAPFYGLMIFIMYRRRVLPAALGGTLGFLEEFFPLTDVVPTATMMWIYTFILRKESTMKAFVKEKEKEAEVLTH